MYHKVAPATPTMWWVAVDDFYRQLCELRRYEVVYLDDYDRSRSDTQAVITFDGVYQNVLAYAAPLLQRFGYPFELFVTSECIGKSNDFDAGSGEPPAQFASEQDLKTLQRFGARLQWHTRTHAKLSAQISRADLVRELEVPDALRDLDPNGFSWVAYPHGEFSEEALSIARTKFRGGVSCHQGNDTDVHVLNRVTATSESSFARATIGVIVPCYKYAHFLPEALESVLRQTRPAHKILIADDCSPDATPEIGQFYRDKYPQLVTYMRNESNAGIVRNFNKAVNEIGTDYVCLLGADNRFRSDYIERTSQALDCEEGLGVAYTDFAMFGPLAQIEYQNFDVSSRGDIIDSVYFTIRFPEFSEASRALLGTRNFIHGSSLFRRAAFSAVGGYLEGGQAEDHNLFSRMVSAGWGAKRVGHPLLEYRKHSLEQANSRLVSQAELNFYKELVRHKDARIRELTEELASQSSLLRVAGVKTCALAKRGFGALPSGARSKLRSMGRQFLVACQKCEHPIFRARFLVPDSIRKKVGKAIWSVQRQYFP